MFGEWVYDYDVPGYGALVEYADGTVAPLDGRERPKIYFENGRPALLTNRVRFPPNPNGTEVFTFVQPIAGWYDDFDRT